MGLPDASADLNEGAFAAMCGKGVHDPILEVVLGCHATRMTAVVTTPRTALSQLSNAGGSE